MKDMLEVVRKAGLSPEDIEREKRIRMAGAVVVTTTNTAMRRRAMAQIVNECKARSPAVVQAIETARAAGRA